VESINRDSQTLKSDKNNDIIINEPHARKMSFTTCIYLQTNCYFVQTYSNNLFEQISNLFKHIGNMFKQILSCLDMCINTKKS